MKEYATTTLLIGIKSFSKTQRKNRAGKSCARSHPRRLCTHTRMTFSAIIHDFSWVSRAHTKNPWNTFLNCGFNVVYDMKGYYDIDLEIGESRQELYICWFQNCCPSKQSWKSIFQFVVQQTVSKRWKGHNTMILKEHSYLHLVQNYLIKPFYIKITWWLPAEASRHDFFILMTTQIKKEEIIRFLGIIKNIASHFWRKIPNLDLRNHALNPTLPAFKPLFES